jgi:GntR family transcriptional regulator
MASDGRFRFHVAPTSGVPIYRQLMDQVRAQTATGTLVVGDYLPSVRIVAAELAVNPMTVSKAYSLLERDGIVELVRGQGMRVTGPAVRSRQGAIRTEVVRMVGELVRKATAASLTPEELCALVNSAFEEHDHERIGARSR